MKKIVCVGSRNYKTTVGGIEIHCASYLPYFSSQFRKKKFYLLTCDSSVSFANRINKNLVHLNRKITFSGFDKIVASFF